MSKRFDDKRAIEKYVKNILKHYSSKYDGPSPY